MKGKLNGAFTGDITMLELLNGTVMQIEKALTNDCLRVLKVS